MTDIQRWYDKNAKLSEMMAVLSSMSPQELDKVSKYLYDVVNIYWKQKKEKEQIVSLGADRLANYYKAYQKRRWYDQNSLLSSAINTLSTLSVQEHEEIVIGFLYALKEVGLYKIYSHKKEQMQEKEKDK